MLFTKFLVVENSKYASVGAIILSPTKIFNREDERARLAWLNFNYCRNKRNVLIQTFHICYKLITRSKRSILYLRT